MEKLVRSIKIFIIITGLILAFLFLWLQNFVPLGIYNGFIGLLFFPLLIIGLLVRREILKNESYPKGGVSTSDSVVHTLETFLGFQRWEWALEVVPPIILLELIWYILVQIRYESYDPLGSSILLAFAAGILFAQHLLQLIPDTLRTIWNRNVLVIKPIVSGGDTKTIMDQIKTGDDSSKSALLKEQYIAFIHDYEYWLNHPNLQYITGIVSFAVLCFLPSILDRGIYSILIPAYISLIPLVYFEKLLEFIANGFICFVIGLLIWRIITTGMQIRKLEETFDIKPILEHRDKCGGLSPVGHLLLWNTMSISIIGLFLGAWIVIVLYSLYLHLIPVLQYTNYLWLFIGMFLGSILLSWACFLVPLRSMHKVLATKRAEILDQLSERIDNLESDLLKRIDKLEPDESEKVTKKLEFMRRSFQIYQQYPVWPFNFAILTKLLLFQATGMLGWTLSLVGEMAKSFFK